MHAIIIPDGILAEIVKTNIEIHSEKNTQFLKYFVNVCDVCINFINTNLNYHNYNLYLFIFLKRQTPTPSAPMI